jgi:RNA polymerase sigma-70 factor, ECF subfamily
VLLHPLGRSLAVPSSISKWRIPMLSLTGNKDDAKPHVPKDFEDWREIPSTALERVEVREALVKALSSLAQHYREAFVLRDI